ncbi:MAG TPA: winged helix-turn-helix domain-containing protein [Anaerolineales bacterium]|nr:winged helix-turn-helix domain-containing protein [Anaerolineales bacterium]
MDILSSPPLEWSPIYPMNRKDVVLDVFKHYISYKDGLPPYALVRIIDMICNRLIKARKYPALWVSVDAPGDWYVVEVKRFVKKKIPMTVQPAWKTTVIEWNFSEHIEPTYLREGDLPILAPRFDPADHGIKESALRALKIMARLKTAYRPEIASLAGFSESHVRNLLKQLQAENLIERRKIGKYEGYAIRTKGLRLAHRSWNIPKGVHFSKYRGEFRYAGERHRRVSRRWRAWLETAYPNIEVLESWTEVPLFYGIPDALVWGRKGEHEILFWLEVDSGHSSQKVMSRNYFLRLQNAYQHANRLGISIVFCIMGPPWAVKAFSWHIPPLPPNMAVIGQDWRAFGKLPFYETGRWFSGIEDRKKYPTENTLPFDPNQYPPKPKKEIKGTPANLKSTKPKYSKGFDDADWWYRSSSEREE